MNETIFGSFEYPNNGGWGKELSEKNIAPDLAIRSGKYTSYTIEIETKEPAEIKIDGDVVKTTRMEASPDIFYRAIKRRGLPSARGVSEFIVPAGVEYRVFFTGTSKR